MQQVNKHFPQSIPSATLDQYRDQSEKGYMGGGFLAPAYGQVVGMHWNGTVDVELRGGVILQSVPVLTQEWVSDMGEKTVGKKKLPPEGAYVLVLFTSGIPESAVVLGSYLDDLSDKQQKELLKEGEELIDRSRNVAGWQEEYHQDTGKFTLKDDDGFSLVVDKENQSITLTDWHGNIVTADETGMITQDANGNKATGSPDGLLLEGVDGDTVELAGGVVKVNGDAKELVTWSELNTALSTFLTQLTTALSTTPIAGNGAPQPTWTGLPTSIDISSAKTAKVKVGG